ncbi:MAG: DNA polymerase Y family protein [Rhodanobacter sp.]
MLWACIVLPHLALDGVLRRRPASDRPLTIVTGTQQARYLLDANDSARAAGLYPGQPLIAAQALLSDFETIDHDPGEVTRWHNLLAAWAYRYSAEVVQMDDAVALEIRHSSGLFGPWQHFQTKLRDDLQQLGFRHRLGLAPCAVAARVLAEAGDGLTAENPADCRQLLAQIPLSLAGLPDDHATTLAGMGIHRLGALLDLPRAGLRRRFGTPLIAHLEQLLDEQPADLPRYRPPDKFEARIELNFEVENIAALAFPLRRMTSDLASYLAGRDGGVQRFALQLEHHGHTPTRLTIGLLHPEREAAVLFELTRSRLDRLTVVHPVVALRLLAQELPPFVPAGRDLFDARPINAIPLEQLRERLRARLGDHSVRQLRPTVDPRPERAQAWCMEKQTTHASSLPRPTWLLPRPIPLRTRGVQIVAGPERLESGWWDGGDVRRDYYVLQTAEGQRAWAFCAAGDHPGERDGWMLHGWFA